MNLTNIIPDKTKAIFFAKKQLPELVCDAVNLEDINYTLPEVQTLLEGVTVGGHKISDQNITLNQVGAWKYLFEAVQRDVFSLTVDFACKLHEVAAKDESLEWGCFRKGRVTISGTSYMPPPAAELSRKWDEMLQEADGINEIYTKAIFVFLQMARNQFFYDVNKRMGKFMMNGILLSHGYPAINLQARKKAEFNKLMLEFYPSGKIDSMVLFMRSCLSEEIVKAMSEK